MIRVRHPLAAHRRMAGLSLIEMMIALVMALIVAAGIITVFASTSSSNKVQTQLAALQEEGRFAIQSLRTDLGNANAGYCSNSGGNAGGTTSGLYLDALRSPTVYSETNIAPAGATAGLFYDNTVALPKPTGPYSLPSSMFMRGYECTATGCSPADPHLIIPAIPAMGTAVGNRVPGTDVLTIRYLKPGSGWALVKLGSGPGSTYSTVTGKPTITLAQLPGEEPTNDFTSGLALLADCSNAQVFAVTGGGTGVLTVLGTGNPGNYAPPLDITSDAAPRIFDFVNDFQTVTYYLQVVCTDATTPCDQTTGELMRRVNGGAAQPIVRGVERLDFRYGIIDANGNTQFLTADKVDTGNSGAIACPPDVSTPGGMPDDSQHGCLWRAVQTIEAHILMDGQTPLYTLTTAELNYIYTPDGNTTPQPASARSVTPATQGFPNQLLRREFTTLVALRNFNP